MPDSNRHKRLNYTIKLLVTGTVAGVFSALFGVGGGVVMVPLLIYWMGYREQEATGTSLAAIVVIATVATATYGIRGNVHWTDGILIGLPAVAGVVMGVALQRRFAGRTIRGVFALLLIVVALQMFIG